MIELEQVSRTFDGFSLLVSLTVTDDEIVTLLGSSGSGKTTTLRMIAGFEKPDSGRLLIDGEDVARLPAQRRRIGYVFQDYTLFPHLNVAENIGYGLRAAGVDRAGRTRRVNELLELIELDRFGGRPVQTLSGGEQQRVAVARALAVQPRALLLDEPFSSIDTERREDLRRHLVNIQRRLHVPTIFVTHSRNEALSISDRIVVLRNGQIDDQGAPEQLYLRPSTAYTARFLGRANLFVRDGELLMIRPEHVRVEQGDVSGDVAISSDDTVTSARVVHVTYHGLYREYELETGLGRIFVHTSARLQSDRAVRLVFPAGQLVPVCGTLPAD